MDFLIFISVFALTLIFFYLLCAHATPFVVNKYRRWQTKRAEGISDKLEDDFIFLEKKKKVLLSFFPLIFAGLGFFILKNILGFAFGFILGLSIPTLLIKLAKKTRFNKFQSQIVDSLMILSSCLKGGLSLIQAIEVMTEEMPIPISQEFGLVLKENRLGIDLEISLRKLRKRMPLEEVNLLVSSILVARETGGELTKVFTRLTETIRNSLKLKEKIATLTLQGRMQGVIMAILPIVFTLFIYKQDPTHFNIMLETQMGKVLIGVAILLQIVGVYLIKRISTLKV
ncbi:MAG: type II secretion system F family protein [Candidatus Omnitrophota bacterium]